MLFLLDVYEEIVIEVLGGGEVFQNVYPVGDEALCVKVVWQIDEFYFALYILKQLVVFKCGIVCAVKITLGNSQRVLSFLCKHFKRQAGVTYSGIGAQDILNSCDYALAVVAGDVHIVSYGISFAEIKLDGVTAEQIGIELQQSHGIGAEFSVCVHGEARLHLILGQK